MDPKKSTRKTKLAAGTGRPGRDSKIKIHESDIHLINLRTRMPFKYGIATMTSVPQIFVRLLVEVEGKSTAGVSADLLPPKWFRKDPNQSVESEIKEMLRVIQNALGIARGLQGNTAFEIWRGLYDAQSQWGLNNRLPPLLTNFGSSLVERALIEAICRAKEQPFPIALRKGKLGIDLGSIHSQLERVPLASVLPAMPLSRIIARHTVGLSDPLNDEEIPAAERVEDGLPQSLLASIQTYGLRHFKIKLGGKMEHDLDRLRRIAQLFEQHVKPDYAFSLDGNEQFKSAEEFKQFWEATSSSPELGTFLRHLLFIEQPLHRDVALSPEIKTAFDHWPERPRIIIDESDATLDSLPAALRLGYAGTSHKNCKGVFKGIANCALIRHRSSEHPAERFIISGEDLCNIGPVALLQDLAVMATLGIESVERNGHHYNAGLSQFPAPIQEQILSHHPDLYQRSAAGWPTLKIEGGEIQVASLLDAPFGPGFVAEVEQFEPLQSWRLPEMQ